MGIEPLTATTRRTHETAPRSKGNPEVLVPTGELEMGFQDHDKMVMLIEVVIRPIEPVPRDTCKVFA